MSSRPGTVPAGFIEPCLPTVSPRPPIGTAWVHEIKHDGIRVITRKTQFGVRLYRRSGNDIAQRFPLIAETVARLPARSCIIDGEAVSCGDDGIAVFERILYKRYDHTVFLYASDIIELNGEDLRPEPLEARKATLGSLLTPAGIGVRLNEHLEHANGVHVFERACRMGLEGIVSKRKGSRYHSGRTLDWMKAKNPNAPAVTRLSREDWGGVGKVQILGLNPEQRSGSFSISLRCGIGNSGCILYIPPARHRACPRCHRIRDICSCDR